MRTHSHCPQIYFITVCPALYSIVSLFAYFCAFVLLLCQHEEKHERKKSVQKSDETEIRKTAENGEMIKAIEMRMRKKYKKKDRNWRRERITFDHICHYP